LKSKKQERKLCFEVKTVPRDARMLRNKCGIYGEDRRVFGI